jgi:predicted SAM-dependent methyltransferase
MSSVLLGLRKRLARSALGHARIDLERASRKKLIVGAGGIGHDDGWVATDRDVLDVTDRMQWERLLGRIRLDVVFAEHVWEHLTDDQTHAANSNVVAFLKPGGTFRLAVPDGNKPDADYIEYVKPGGSGAGADDHKVLYDYKLMRARLEAAGFAEVKLLEYWDEHAQFHCEDWNPADGRVRRSRRFDDRNQDGVLRYTSLIVDAVTATCR